MAGIQITSNNVGQSINIKGLSLADIEPFGKYCLIERLGRPEVTPGGVLIAKNAWEKNYYARLVAKGEGEHQEDGQFIEATRFEPNDIVLVRPYNGRRFLRFGEQFQIVDGKLIEAKAVAEPWPEGTRKAKRTKK